MHRFTKICARTLGACGLAAFGARAGAQAPWTTVDAIQPVSVEVKPGPAVATGTLVTLTCHWKKTASVAKHLDWPDTKALAKAKWKLHGKFTLDGKTIATFQVPAQSGKDADARATQWPASTPGIHDGSCSIDAENLANIQGTKTIDFKIHVTAQVGATGPARRAPGQPMVVDKGVLVPIQPKIPPDLTAGAVVSVYQQAAQWQQGEIVVDAGTAAGKFAQNGGECSFPVSYEIRNIGGSPSGAFGVLLQSAAPSGGKASFTSIPAGESKQDVVYMRFKSGSQSLGLKVDAQNAVNELNEKNNSFGVRFRVAGSCMPTR